MARIEGDKEQRIEAARALAEDPVADAADELIAALRDRARRVRRFAAEALGKLGHYPAIPALIEALEDDEEDPACRRQAAEALGRIGAEETVPTLTCQLHGSSGVIGIAAADALARIGTPEAQAALRLALDHQTRRGDAAQALATLGYVPAAQAERVLYCIARKDDAVVREGSAALDPLLEELERKNSWAPWAALMLEHILATHRGELPQEDLRGLAALEDRNFTWSHYDARIEADREEIVHVDCAAIRRLANEEIDRRDKANA